MKRNDVPDRYRRLYDRAMGGRSRQAAIRANCLMCVGWSTEEVRRCTARNCPLYPYRKGHQTATGATHGEESTLCTPEIELAAPTPL